MEAWLFYPCALLAVLGALGVVLLRKPTRALLSLILTLFALTALFLLLKAYFVAMVQLIVYAGAVIVLFLFVIMLLGIGGREPALKEFPKKIFLSVALFVPVAFLGLFLYLAKHSLGTQAVSSGLIPAEGSPEAFGRLLFARYLLPFELVSFLLLIGVFAAVALASSPKE